MTLRLEPHKDVRVEGDRFVSTSEAPWLRLSGCTPRRGSWFRLSYAASYLDHLTRPLIQYEGTDEWDVMRAPYFGRAHWVGYFPEDAEGILISPVNKPGPFRFVVESFAQVFLPGLYLRALRNDPKTALMSIGARIIGAKQETRQALMFARGGVSLSRYESWRRETSRPFDPDKLDAPYRDGTLDQELPHVRLISEMPPGGDLFGSPLWESLVSQSYPNWSLALTNAERDGFQLFRPHEGGGAPFITSAETLTADLDGVDLLAFAPLNASMAPYALPCLSESALANPGADLFYGDSDEASPQGRHSPRLLPDWSPRFQDGARYLPETMFHRARSLPQGLGAFDPATVPGSNGIVHIRRMFITYDEPEVAPRRGPARPSTAQLTSWPRISVIIPSKDRTDLIGACVNSLLRHGGSRLAEILIIDNGSSAATFDFYATLDANRVRIIEHPGAFNFSKMCNRGADEAEGEVLLFLNNDVEVINGDWLAPLVAAAQSDGVGVVGPKLLFPGGGIQHAGVVVGMGGYADHVFQGEPSNYPGYLNKLTTTHETSAVTGAVMMIWKDRFRAAGGFDEQNFPVELNDIDLCLRLNRMGLQTLLCPHSVLIHRQSSSRGFHFKPFTKYALERGRFRRNWQAEIRDDGCFHPALSLFSTRVSLDG